MSTTTTTTTTTSRRGGASTKKRTTSPTSDGEGGKRKRTKRTVPKADNTKIKRVRMAKHYVDYLQSLVDENNGIKPKDALEAVYQHFGVTTSTIPADFPKDASIKSKVAAIKRATNNPQK